MASARRWTFTNFQMDWDFDKLEDRIESGELKYCVFQKEKCPDTGKKHFQGYAVFGNAIRRKGAQKVLGIGKSHMEIAKGTNKQNFKYCTKEETRVGKHYYEFGDFSDIGQGKRSDLKKATEAVIEGGIDMLVETHPEMFVKFHKGFQALEDRLAKHREKPAKIYFIYGKAGAGKTELATKICGDYYIKDPTSKWWDGWDGENVIIDDMRDWIVSKDYTLRLLDRYKLNVS